MVMLNNLNDRLMDNNHIVLMVLVSQKIFDRQNNMFADDYSIVQMDHEILLLDMKEIDDVRLLIEYWKQENLLSMLEEEMLLNQFVFVLRFVIVDDNCLFLHVARNLISPDGWTKDLPSDAR